MPRYIISPDFVSQAPKIKKGITMSRAIPWVTPIVLSADSIFLKDIPSGLPFKRPYEIHKETIAKVMKTEILLKPMKRDKKKVSQVNKSVPTIMAKDSRTHRFSYNPRFRSIMSPSQTDKIMATAEIKEYLTTL